MRGSSGPARALAADSLSAAVYPAPRRRAGAPERACGWPRRTPPHRVGDGVIVKGILDQKARLWRRYKKTRSWKLRNKLVETYLPLVRSIAGRWGVRLPIWVDRNDLVSAGVFGLVGAIESFDPNRGTRFESYCQVRVQGAIRDELRHQDWLSRASRHRGMAVSRARSELAQRLGREPSDREVATHLGISPEELKARELEFWATQVVSLDAPFGAGDEAGTQGESTCLNLVASEDLPADIVHRRELIKLVDGHLTAIERVIVFLHYHKSMKLKQVARVLHLSDSRITQLHNRLLKRLKKKLSYEAV
ncbi:MAG: FliA/WhiG family RNA polymerase sigma factor [Planctomycetota bacterium]